jgi:hypothetical protein
MVLLFLHPAHGNSMYSGLHRALLPPSALQPQRPSPGPASSVRSCPHFMVGLHSSSHRFHPQHLRPPLPRTPRTDSWTVSRVDMSKPNASGLSSVLADIERPQRNWSLVPQDTKRSLRQAPTGSPTPTAQAYALGTAASPPQKPPQTGGHRSGAAVRFFLSSCFWVPSLRTQVLSSSSSRSGGESYGCFWFKRSVGILLLRIASSC